MVEWQFSANSAVAGLTLLTWQILLNWSSHPPFAQLQMQPFLESGAFTEGGVTTQVQGDAMLLYDVTWPQEPQGKQHNWA